MRNGNEETDPLAHAIRKENRQNYEAIVDKLSKALPLPALERRKKIDEENAWIRNDLLRAFLEKLKQTHENAIGELQTQLTCIERDMNSIDSGNTDAINKQSSFLPTDLFPKHLRDKRKRSDASLSSQSDESKENDEMMTKKRRIDERFDDLRELYLGCCGDSRGNTDLDDFASMLDEVTRYSRFRVLDTMYYTDISATSSIVSSIDFDRDDEYFAIGGVTKDIKVYDFSMMGNNYSSVTEELEDSNKELDGSNVGGSQHNTTLGRNDRPLMIHCPIGVMQCGHKISCLSWNPYIKSQLASSDYEGIINVWDASTGQCLRSFEEHKHRAWSVDTCTRNPTLLASGSDDTTVKIWSIQSRQSIHTLELRGNVCCAKFSPENSYHLAVGSADHHASCYDLRFLKTPLIVFRGHKKAVSYVKWISSHEIVSASTDSTLKLWSVDSLECQKTYTGHRNEKNFAGLSLNGNWIACGSETNTLYVYHKSSTMPVTTYKFPVIHPLTFALFMSEKHSSFPKRKISCVPCRLKKVKCNGVKPCERCKKKNAAHECNYRAPAPPGRPPKNAVLNKLVLSRCNRNILRDLPGIQTDFIYEHERMSNIAGVCNYLSGSKVTKEYTVQRDIKASQLVTHIKMYDLLGYFTWLDYDLVNVLCQRLGQLQLEHYRNATLYKKAADLDASTDFFESRLKVSNPFNSLLPHAALRLIECFFMIHPYSVLLNKTLLLQSYWTDTADPLLLSVVFGTTIYKSQMLEGQPITFSDASSCEKRNPFLNYAYFLLSRMSSEATLSRFQAVVLLALFEQAFGYPKRGMALSSLAYTIGAKLGVYKQVSSHSEIQGISELEYELLLMAAWAAYGSTVRSTARGIIKSAANNTDNLNGHESKDVETAIGEVLDDYKAFIDKHQHTFSDIQHYTLYVSWLLLRFHCTFLQSAFRKGKHDCNAEFMQKLKDVIGIQPTNWAPGSIPTEDFDLRNPDTFNRIQRVLPLVIEAIDKTQAFLTKFKNIEARPLPLGPMVSLLETCARLLIMECNREYDERWKKYLDIIDQILTSGIWQQWTIIDIITHNIRSFVKKCGKPPPSATNFICSSVDYQACDNDSNILNLAKTNDLYGIPFVDLFGSEPAFFTKDAALDCILYGQPVSTPDEAIDYATGIINELQEPCLLDVMTPIEQLQIPHSMTNDPYALSALLSLDHGIISNEVENTSPLYINNI
ncbi:coatomer subunit alpha [Apophysomyces ossiformis]|uniref:Coatomer subunit alpha n=1 Tax=Apophysomyces ossiformis TaxID=679940 RepID=A0A8H7BYQ6_9FUNG|nr:coatomer subunit alpha [Apophysomyces ossiformis]